MRKMWLMVGIIVFVALVMAPQGRGQTCFDGTNAVNVTLNHTNSSLLTCFRIPKNATVATWLNDTFLLTPKVYPLWVSNTSNIRNVTLVTDTPVHNDFGNENVSLVLIYNLTGTQGTRPNWTIIVYNGTDGYMSMWYREEAGIAASNYWVANATPKGGLAAGLSTSSDKLFMTAGRNITGNDRFHMVTLKAGTYTGREYNPVTRSWDSNPPASANIKQCNSPAHRNSTVKALFNVTDDGNWTLFQNCGEGEGDQWISQYYDIATGWIEKNASKSGLGGGHGITIDALRNATGDGVTRGLLGLPNGSLQSVFWNGTQWFNDTNMTNGLANFNAGTSAKPALTYNMSRSEQVFIFVPNATGFINSSVLWRFPLNVTYITTNTGSPDYRDILNPLLQPNVTSANSSKITNQTGCTADASGYCNITLNVSGLGRIEFLISNFSYHFNNTGVVTCGAISNTRTLNFTIQDEENFTPIASDFKAVFNVNFPSIGVINNTFDLTGNSTYILCIYPANANYTLNATINYINDSYTNRWYYLVNTQISNVTQGFRLYHLLNSLSTIVPFTVKNNFQQLQSEVIIQALRYYPGTDDYRIVAMIKTGEDGTGVMQLELYEFYRFILSKYNTTLASIKPIIISTAQTLYTSTGDNIELFKYFNGVVSSCPLRPTNGIYTCTYSDVSGCLSSARLEVTRVNILNNTHIICSDSSSSPSGALSCNVSAYVNNTLGYTLIGNFQCSSQEAVLQSGGIDLTTGLFSWGITGILIGFMIVLSMALLGLWNPPVAVILTTFGLVISYIFGFIPVGIGSLIGLIVVAIVIVYKSKVG